LSQTLDKLLQRAVRHRRRKNYFDVQAGMSVRTVENISLILLSERYYDTNRRSAAIVYIDE